MNKVLITVLFFTFFLLGCYSELPPEPGRIGPPIGEAYGIYDGYGLHYDVFDDNKQIFSLNKNIFNLPADQDSFMLGIDVTHEDGFVYKYGHYYTRAGWEQYQFPEKTFSGSNWIKDSASTFLKIDASEINPGENYLVAYSCKRYDQQWKCGCSNEYGPCNQWMLQTYLFRHVELPPEPIPPGSIITTEIHISPNGRLVRQGDVVNLYAHLESTWDILHDIDNLPVKISNPEVGEGLVQEEIVELDKLGDVDCKECSDDDCGNQFLCDLSFSGSYMPPVLGEYLIEFGEDVVEWVKVNNGKFKVVSDDFFKEYLIEEDIESFDFGGSYGWYSGGGFGLSADYQKSSVYASVSVQNFPWVFDRFQSIKNDGNYEAGQINGNLIYVREWSTNTPYYYGSIINRIEAVWLSDGKLITVYLNGANLEGIVMIIEAYLEKHPSLGFENYPEFLIKDNELDAIFVVGDNAPAEDVIAVVDIVTSLQFHSTPTEGGGETVPIEEEVAEAVEEPEQDEVEVETEIVYISPIQVGATKLASEVANPKAQNMILVGRPTTYAGEEANVLIDDFELPELSSGVSLLKIAENGDYYAVIVTGRDKIGPRNAAKILANWKDYSHVLKGKEIIVTATVLTACIDSDGGKNYYVKGTATDSSTSKTDNCFNDGTNRLAEYYCDGNVAEQINYNCPNGCQDGACTAGEEAWKVETSNSKLELSENLIVGENTESIADITEQSFIGNTELPNVLASGTASNSKDDFPYNQKLYFEDNLNTGYVQLNENEEDVTADFLYFKSGKQIAKYELEFTTALESDVEGSVLTDFEDVYLVMLGKEYVIVQAKTLIPNHITLVLMGGAVKDVLLEGETKTYTINGIDYEVSLDFVDANSVKFTINGDPTRSLLVGETDKISDGTTIGVSDILYQDFAGGVRSAEFFLGADKISLKDSDVTDTLSSNELKANDETVDGASVMIQGSVDSSTSKIDKITINMIADDDYYVPQGEKLSEQLDEPDLLFTRNWDIEYSGVEGDNPMNRISIATSGTDTYKLEFVDGSGNDVKIPLVFADSGFSIKLGDENDDLVLNEDKVISKDDYFVITDESDINGKRKSYALRYKGADKLSADSPVLKFQNLGTGEVIERGYSNSAPLATLNIGGNEYGIYSASSTDSSSFDIQIDLDGNGALEDKIMTINTEHGANIDIKEEGEKVKVSISTPNSEDYEDLKPTPFMFDLFASSFEVMMELDENQNHNFLTPDGQTDNLVSHSSYGAVIEMDREVGKPPIMGIEYPQTQIFPQVFIIGEYEK